MVSAKAKDGASDVMDMEVLLPEGITMVMTFQFSTSLVF